MSYTAISSTKDKNTKPHQSLTKRESAFVKAVLANGGNFTQAIQTIGYTGANPSAAASQMWRRSHVRAAFEAAIADKVAVSKALALNTLERIARDGESEHAQLAAANSIWDKAEQLQGIGKGHAGITINIGLRNASDIAATQIIEHEGQALDVHAITEGKQGDDLSE